MPELTRRRDPEAQQLIRRDFHNHLARVYRKPVFWSWSYCIISCGGAPLSVLKQHIEQQAAPQ
jgi:putative transposase